MTPWRVWFSRAGASQALQRPWAVRDPEGQTYLAVDVVMVAARTAFLDAGFRELREGPRGILECDDVVMVSPMRWEES